MRAYPVKATISAFFDQDLLKMSTLSSWWLISCTFLADSGSFKLGGFEISWLVLLFVVAIVYFGWLAEVWSIDWFNPTRRQGPESHHEILKLDTYTYSTYCPHLHSNPLEPICWVKTTPLVNKSAHMTEIGFARHATQAATLSDGMWE